MKRTPLRRVSAKQAKRLKEYAKLRKQFLADHQFCEAMTFVPLEPFKKCQIYSATIHHMGHGGSVKRGSNTNNTDDWLACCMSCHQWIEAHKNEAREIGLLA